MKKKVIMCIIAAMLVALAGTIAYKAGYTTDKCSEFLQSVDARSA
ncbi:hypothetical protein SG0102_13770 [Intestinibaculum porci]|uniref:Cyclic lactone autoinducer peptide n=1 Tax=Intestinibaculum porci TaxID=2487118 RepID=A0A3G9JN64_9FIRM|nr:hypothetical protein [Intestinibaculum porci]BBH26443.1 hypothetical protein SG0102_13770 [Intestinibaculum porci]